ncbi:hypothetical protein Tco_1133585 [Tanacetum coccineum]
MEKMECWTKEITGRRIDDSILRSNNTTTESFFKPYLITHGKNDTEKEDEQSQTKRKYSNTSNSIDEQPNKRRCKAEKFEAIQYSLGPNEEYIAIRGYEFDIWERNDDNLSIIYQDIFQKKDEGWKSLDSSRLVSVLISSISIGSSNVQPSESPYLPVLFIGTSQSRQHDKSESMFWQYHEDNAYLNNLWHGVARTLKMAKRDQSNFRAISSPIHPTSNIEDSFSSNFPDYIPASPDYVPASPGKTYSSSSNNSFGLVPIASLTLSLFHDDPFMKVMHAYYAKESPILPPTIMPPSSMLSLMFNPQEFFLPEELLPLKKRGESSRKTSLERHEEQIEEILNHLDELSLDRIKNIEDKIEGLGNGRYNRMPPKRTSTSEAPAMTQAAIRKLVADSVATALEAQATTMANADNTNRNNGER